MVTGRRPKFLLFAVTILVVLQQASVWWRNRAADKQVAGERSHIIEIADQGERAQAELAQTGRLWIGELHNNEGDWTADDERQVSARPRSARSVAGRIELKPDDLSADFEFHECDPGSALCSTGGSITVLATGRRMCAITVGILREQSTGVSGSDYRVLWEHRDDVAALTESERLAMLQVLAGDSALLDRGSFHHLLREAYAGDPGSLSAEASSELVAGKLFRAVLRAIVESRSSKSSTR